MHRYKLMLVLAVLVSIQAQLFAQMIQPSPCNLNTGVNSEALKWMQKKGIVLSNDPIMINSTICNFEFMINGTCCQVDSLTARINKVNTDMKNRWTEYILKLASIRNNLVKGIRKIGPKLSELVINTIQSQANAYGSSVRFADILPLLPKEPASIASLKKWIEEFEKEVIAFRNQGKTCFNKLRDTRANIHCLMCSAKAGEYAQAQGASRFTYNVNRETCSDIVNSCFPVWKFNFNLLTLS